MKTSFIVLIALVLCSFAAAQRLEINGDNYSTSSSQQTFIQDVAQDYFMKWLGISKEDITSHLGLLLAGILHYFMDNFSLGPLNGESIIPMIMQQAFGKDYIEQATNSAFRLQAF